MPRYGTGLGDARAAGSGWAQVFDVGFVRMATEWPLPARVCPCCGRSRLRTRRRGRIRAGVLRAVLNTAAVVLTGYGNVPAERAADLIGMLTGIPVSPGWVDKASSRLEERLGKAGFDPAMVRRWRAGRRWARTRPRVRHEAHCFYRPRSGHEPEEVFVGPMTYLDP